MTLLLFVARIRKDAFVRIFTPSCRLRLDKQSTDPAAAHMHLLKRFRARGGVNIWANRLGLRALGEVQSGDASLTPA